MAKRYDIRQVTRYVLVHESGDKNISSSDDLAQFWRQDRAEISRKALTATPELYREHMLATYAKAIESPHPKVREMGAMALSRIDETWSDKYEVKAVTRYVLTGGDGIDEFHDIAEFKRYDEAKAVMGELNAAAFLAERKVEKDAEDCANYLITKLKDSVNGFMVTTGRAQYDTPPANHSALIFDKIDSEGFVSKSSYASEDAEQAEGAIFDFLLRLKDYLADRPGMIVWRKQPKFWAVDRPDAVEFSVHAELAVVAAGRVKSHADNSAFQITANEIAAKKYGCHRSR